jgi:hypothetical protein
MHHIKESGPICGDSTHVYSEITTNANKQVKTKLI